VRFVFGKTIFSGFKSILKAQEKDTVIVYDDAFTFGLHLCNCILVT